MLNEIKVPLVGVNDKYAKIVQWNIKDEHFVKKGEILCFLETTKIVFELESEFSGFIKIIMPEGMRIKIQSTIGYIAETLEELKKIDFNKRDNEKENIRKRAGEIVVTKKAMKVAKEYGINLKQIKKIGIIREKDIVNYYKKNILNSQKIKNEADNIFPEINEGKLDEYFLNLIKKDENFKWLTSELKIYLYKKFGAKIESNVKINKGTIILSKNIVIKADSKIGEGCNIKCDNFYLGKMGVIGNKANIVTRRLYIDDVFFSGNNILIGGGGAYGERSGLKIGKCCLISSNCIINTGYPVIIEDNVGISPNVSIFTHSHWQNILKGYKVNFGSVIIKEGSYITGNVMIVPGVKIGKGATVLANSLVLEDVNDYSIVCGVPAREVYKINPNLSLKQKDEIFKRIFNELKQEIKDKGFNAERLLYNISLPKEPIQDIKLYLGLEVPESLKKLAKTTKQFTIFDIGKYETIGKEDNLSDEVRNFLRKRGIKFSPIYWRYTKDEGFFNQ